MYIEPQSIVGENPIKIKCKRIAEFYRTTFLFEIFICMLYIFTIVSFYSILSIP